VAFLSVKGVEAHFKTCAGVPRSGDFVVCPGCAVRFRTYSIMAKHHAKAHGPLAAVKSGPAEAVESDDDTDVGRASPESQEAKRLRILAESRLISTPRSRGRPKKTCEADSGLSVSGLQYSDPFDMKVDVMEVPLATGETGKSPKPFGAPFNSRLANYKELVIKYEQLANEATKMAMEDPPDQRSPYEEELKRREADAKKKLAGAVEILQKKMSAGSAGVLSNVPDASCVGPDLIAGSGCVGSGAVVEQMDVVAADSVISGLFIF
jgi:uncharacterized C2H2 Zn-finger protein